MIRRTIPCFALLAALGWIAAGCASKNVNPPVARHHTGYVDFCSGSETDLWWQVDRVEPPDERLRRVFRRDSPLQSGILRLAFRPGHYRFRVTFRNIVIDRPGFADVDVQDGRIVPVFVTLEESGTASVRSRRVRVTPRPFGNAKITYNEAATFIIHADPQPPVPYQIKEHMDYGRIAPANLTQH